jgi:hydrogenase maturation protein HypF
METYKAFEQTIDHYRNLFKVTSEAIACDSHPDFISSDYAARLSRTIGKPLYRIQHHHAHLAACLGENKWLGEKAIGLCFDGTGYGDDGAIWGGEILVGNYQNYQRRFHLEYMPLPGGDTSIRKPYRMALAYLSQTGIEWTTTLPPVPYCRKPERDILSSQLTKKINTIPTSSLGRLFDVVASLTGIGQHASYEGQLAIELENAIDPLETGQYSFGIEDDIILIQPMLHQVVSDCLNQVPASQIAAKFHNGLAHLNLEICEMIRSESGLDEVALSGGVWQNKTLFESTIDLLKRHGFHVLTHQQLPTNDGCISYGQAIIAGHLLLERKS